MNDVYHFNFYKNNVYGHVVELIKQYGATTGVHLDIGCGYGAIAEPLRQMGLTYVGVDIGESGLEDLKARGFEVHAVDLQDVTALHGNLQAVLAGRELASISVLDTLEHVRTDSEILAALRALVQATPVPLMISVPNVTHRDVAIKLFGGRWDYTEHGLLDHTHVIHHTESLLTQMCAKAGWRQVGELDVHMEKSDQHFPADNVMLSPNSLLGGYLRRLKSQSDQNATVNQLVRAYLPAPPRPDTALQVDREPPARPFLSIITRTQGRRAGTLRDVLLCLAAQTCQDFELIVIAHKVSVEQQLVIERLIEDQPAYMRNKTRLILLDHGGRTAPLNLGFEEARGSYAAILDDDDLVFSHWVEIFRDLAANGANGNVLRAVTVEQDIESVTWSNGVSGFRVSDALRKIYPSEFDLIEHLTQNYTPPMCYAIPTSVFHDLGVRFDEALDTAEDWDFEMQAAFLCGVQSTPAITAIYHRWVKGESSYTVHSRHEWERDHRRILEKMDAQSQLFPAGTTRRIREQKAWIVHLEREIADLNLVINASLTVWFKRKCLAAARRGYNFAKKVARKLGIRRRRV
ncbi:methyltransferase domain-containing protein [Chitinimonas naiadis]